MFRFSSNFLLPFINIATYLWNQKHERFRTYISYQKSSHAELFLQSASLKLLEMFWIHCCHVSRVPKKTHWKRSFLVIFFFCCCEFRYRYFNMFICKLWDNLFSSSSGSLLLKNVKHTSTSFKEGGMFFNRGWIVYMENIVPAKPGFRLEEAKPRLAWMEWKMPDFM